MADSQATTAWDKNHPAFIGLMLNNSIDAKIIAKLDTVPSKQGHIKALIKADISPK